MTASMQRACHPTGTTVTEMATRREDAPAAQKTHEIRETRGLREASPSVPQDVDLSVGLLIFLA